LRLKITPAALAILLAGGSVRAAQPAQSAAKKPAPSTGKTGPSKAGPSKASPAQAGAAKSAVNAKKPVARTAPPVRHYAQQQPTPDRFKEIQQALSDRGYFKGPVDGQWGAESVEALKQFQREQKIDEDGKITSLSLIALGLGPRRILPATAAQRSLAVPADAESAQAGALDSRTPDPNGP
jgi:peptidoglycan hydrolase-like protein with peptidoglycan-binding domain